MNVSEAFKSRSMKSMLGDHVLRNGLSKIAPDQTRQKAIKLLPGPSSHEDGSSTSKQGRTGSVFSTMNKLVQRKLSLGAKIVQVGGVEKVFRRIFSVREGEQLLKASQCCLSTTAGPIPGRLFISTEKLAFCSDKPIAKYASPAGELLRFHYKVVIPLRKIKRTNQSENVKKPSQKYLQVTTTDDFEFWFMGFFHYKRTFKCLQQSVSKSLIN